MTKVGRLPRFFGNTLALVVSIFFLVVGVLVKLVKVSEFHEFCFLSPQEDYELCSSLDNCTRAGNPELRCRVVQQSGMAGRALPIMVI